MQADSLTLCQEKHIKHQSDEFGTEGEGEEALSFICSAPVSQRRLYVLFRELEIYNTKQKLNSALDRQRWSSWDTWGEREHLQLGGVEGTLRRRQPLAGGDADLALQRWHGWMERQADRKMQDGFGVKL